MGILERSGRFDCLQGRNLPLRPAAVQGHALPTPSLPLLRTLILALLVFGMTGAIAELMLLEHFESPWQWAPLIALGLGLAAVAAHLTVRSAATIRLIRGTMAAMVGIGLLGLVQHLRGNLEFELEIRPGLEGWDLLWESLQGATPVLAPGVLIQLGLLGLIFTLRHPRLSPESAPEAPPSEHRP